ncbi:hypothetical protein [Virgibacillus ainsalahensis]
MKADLKGVKKASKINKFGKLINDKGFCFTPALFLISPTYLYAIIFPVSSKEHNNGIDNIRKLTAGHLLK